MDFLEWIELILPNVVDAILNGFILTVFVTKWLNPKIAQTKKKQDIRDEIIKEFWKKLQGLNNNFIKANFNTMNNPQTINNNLELLKNNIFELIEYYDTNEFDLIIFNESFNDIKNKWDYFVNLLIQYQNSPLDNRKKKELGEALQSVKDANRKLINEVRDKY